MDDANELMPYLQCLADVDVRRVDWISPGRLAFGKTTILDGDPGLGKSTVALQWAADMTRGRPIMGGPALAPRPVIVLSAEDAEADTIRPRLEAAAADLSKVYTFKLRDLRGRDHLVSIPAHLDWLEHQIVATNTGMVIVDPFMAFLDDVKSNNDQSVRRALSPLAGMADETGCAVLLLRHLNKQTGGFALYRGGGSMGIVGASRFALVVAKDPDDDTGKRRVIAMQKVNIGTEPTSIAYALEAVPDTDVARVAWLGTSPHTANDLLSAPADEVELTKRDEARTWLRDALNAGPVATKELQRASRDTGIGWRTFESAKRDLGVRADKAGDTWRWALSDPTVIRKNGHAANVPDDPNDW
jgi:hypothetical protein